MTPAAAPAPSYRPGLRRRLMLAFSGYALLVLAMFGLLALVFAYAVEDGFFEAMLRTEAARQHAHRAAHGRWTEPVLPFVRLYDRGLGLPEPLAQARKPGRTTQELVGDGGRHHHLLALAADGSVLVADVGDQLVVRPMRPTLLRWLALFGAALTLVALVVAWVLARRSSAPLEQLACQVAAARPDALPQGLAAGLAHDEVGELARHLDALHDRTRAFIAREQAFTADASHELRTPLAVMGIACERLRDAVPPAGQPLLQSVQTALWQLQQTVDLLLALAREAPGDAGPAAPRPLLPELEQVVLSHAPLLDRHGFTLDIEVPASVTRAWPPALTRLLLGNLLSNAMAHARSPHIRIAADSEQLSVSNDSGPPPEALLTEGGAGRTPGVKGPDSAGHGLGLSIVRRVAERQGLRLDLSHRDGRTRVTLRGAAPAA